MLMKSSISFSKNTLFSQSVSSASISSVWRRIELRDRRRWRREPLPPSLVPQCVQSTSRMASSAMAAAAPGRSSKNVRHRVLHARGSVLGLPWPAPAPRKPFRGLARRTRPAPDVAESNNTRGFAFISREFLRMQAALACLALARGDFFQNSSRDCLQFPEPCQVVLKIMIQELRLLRAELRPQNHVTQFYGMWKQRVFLQFLERNPGVVVIHGFPQQKTLPPYCTQLLPREGGYPKSRGRDPTRQSPPQA